MNTGNFIIGQIGPLSQYEQINKGDAFYRALQALQKQERKMAVVDGRKPVVVCGGNVTEAKDMVDAQRIAEAEAHRSSADAYILKPVRRVSPQREVVTSELA